MILLDAAQGGPPVPLSVVISIVSCVATAAFGVIQWLGRIAWSQKETIMNTQNQAAREMADSALRHVAEAQQREIRRDERIAELERQHGLLAQAYGRTADDVDEIKQQMVTRELFTSAMDAQTQKLMRSIGDAQQGRTSSEPARPAIAQPPMRPPQRSRP